jgi:hypothetical protein
MHSIKRQTADGGSNMRTKFMAPFVVLALLTLWVGGASALAADSEGVALAIVYDTSGSMKEPVRDREGGSTAKYVIANRALLSVVQQLQAFGTNSSRPLEVGLFVFQGDGAREAVKFGPFDPQALQNFARRFSAPNGNTPLGNALGAAAHKVLSSPQPRKHVLIITDGVNTAGEPPAVVLPRLKAEADQKKSSFAVHFIAFDVNAGVFSGVKKQGATVVAAADEKQLNSQLEYILQRKILLEDEEPKK